MDTLLSLKIFRQVVQSGSFTRAAEQLDISVAMASKHISHLENTVKAKLLHRNSRSLHLTEAGEEYYRQCSYALDTLDTAAQKAAGGVDKPQGQLRVTMPLWFANPLLSGWLTEYRHLYPEVSLDLVLDNRHIDLIAEGFDLALRVSKTPAPSLIVRPLAEIRFVIVASPAYLAEHGTPETPEDLVLHQAVLPSYTDMRHLTLTHRESGRTSDITLTPVIQTDNTLMIRELAAAGAGIGVQPHLAVEQDLQQGRLVHLLPDYDLPGNPLNAAYVDRAFLSAKVRSFIDFLTEKMEKL
ncbi:LysR family transcriptional regulator [Neisseria chenwenguii]|uniref:LysR family transcriptional regulator n=1 Tax=Neisseria chenwenguii TaxID=1853278 RepID=A0A220S2M5_9NEIS|nr:LysR family transcriptional regulator [Neisseria chenwenguii]ASK27636.1 LysR family transcriptional regulator [Neisseria chenwenguii]ROV54434.1 LysR family transcriptional regulator [Neisseria chenwenguii]